MFSFRPPRRSYVSRDHDYAIRKGDALALAFIRAGLVRQYGEEFEIGVDRSAEIGSGEFIDIIGNGLYRGSAETHLPIPNSIVWALANYAASVMGAFPSLPITERCNDSIVIAPLFDARYNLDRNWEHRNAQDLAQECLKTGREVIIVGGRNASDPGGGTFFSSVKFPGCRMVLDDVAATCKAIRECAVFIGGDTGTTHYAGAIESDCMVIALYGENSRKPFPFGRRSPCSSLDKYVSGNPPSHFDYTPIIRPSHKFFYHEFPNVRIPEIIEQCANLTSAAAPIRLTATTTLTSTQLVPA